MEKRKMILTIVVTVLVLMSGSAWGTDYYVDGTNGSDAYDGLAAVWNGTNGPKATIGGAINASSNGDTIIVAEGTYFGDWDAGFKPNCKVYEDLVWIPPINPQGKNIIITSTDPDDDDVVANTIISGWWAGIPIDDCDEQCKPCADGWLTACQFENGETSDCEIKGFTILAGQSHELPPWEVACAAIECTNNSFPTITKCSFPTNEEHDITAIYCKSTSSGSMKIQDCIFSGLDSGSIPADDGVIEIKGASGAEILNCTIENNDNFSFGVYCINDGSDYPGNVTVKNSTITGCPIGLWYNGDSTLTISDYCYIVDNDNRGIEFDGSNGGSIKVSNCNISGNGDNSKDGGGIYVYGNASSSIISNCIFEENYGDCGGGLAVKESSSLDVNNSVFQGNKADDGGGLHNQDSFIDVTGCTFIGNSADSFGGGGIYTYAAFYDADSEIVNCIFWNNIALGSADGNQIGLDKPNASVSVDYSNVQGGEGDVYNRLDRGTLNWGEVGDNIDEPPRFTQLGYFAGDDRGALDFDGDNDYVALSENAVTTTEFTISGWANHYGEGGGESNSNKLFVQRDNAVGNNKSAIGLTTDNSGSALASIRSSSGSTQVLDYPRKPYNEWHHYAITVDSANFIFYIDGVEVDSTSNNQSGDYTTSIDHVYIGRNAYSGHPLAESFNGLIDEVMIFNAALSSDEIKDLHERGGDWAMEQTTRLVSYWRLDEDSGQVASDEVSSSSNHGQLGTESYADDSDPAWVTGRVEADDSDAVWALGDYHLLSDSPCIDTGDPDGDYSGQTDIDGEPREMDGDGDEEQPGVSATVDMGADEFSNLISYWKFDEGTGPTAYDSLGYNDGTLTGPPFWTTGIIDGALDFDGVNDYVQVSDEDSLEPDHITVAAWVYRESTSTKDAILQKGSTHFDDDRNGYIFRITESSHATNPNKATFHIVVNNGCPSAPPSTTGIGEDTWYHIAATYNGSYIRMYVNGNEEGTATSETGTIDYTGGYQDFKIGVTEEGHGVFHNYFDGKIDDVRVYGRALSEDEIEDICGLGIE